MLSADIERFINDPRRMEDIRKLVKSYNDLEGDINSPGERSRVPQYKRDQKQILSDLEKIRNALALVHNTPFTDKWGFATEFQNLLEYMPDMPFRAVGGDNITETSRGISNRLKTVFFVELEKELGTDLAKLALRKGVFDADILKIEAYVNKHLKKSDGVQGTIAEKAKEVLQVSETAWKVYNILRKVMESSQRTVTAAGFVRSPRRGYIGQVRYGP